MSRPCALYARFSSDRQNPRSCDDQLRACREFAAAKGWQVSGAWRDDGISGARGRADRGGWDDLLTFIEQGGLDGGVVLTWDWDRWSRDPYDGPIARMQVQRLGVDVADTVSGIFGRDFAGQILATVKEQGSADFLVKLRRAVKRGLKAKREAGFYTCPPPFGYDLERREGGAVLVFNEETRWVHDIYTALDRGDTPAHIARELNRSGVATKRGSKWTPATVRGIARSPVYMGKIAVYGTRLGGAQRSRSQVPEREIEVLDGRHGAVVPDDLWERVQASLTPGRRGASHLREYPLSGLVRCGECGRTCQVTGGEWPYRNYRCRPYGVDVGCTSRRIIRVGLLEDAVAAWAVTMAADAKSVASAGRVLAARESRAAWVQSSKLNPARQEIRSLERKQEKLLESLYAGGAPALINRRLVQIEAQLEEARAALDAVGKEIVPMSAADLADVIRGDLEAGADDLGRPAAFVEWIILPADPGQPPIMRAFNRDFSLSIPATAKDRTRWAATGDSKK